MRSGYVSERNLHPIIIFIFKVYFVARFDYRYLIISIDILQYFFICYWHSVTLLSKSELLTSPLIAKLSTDSKALYIIIIMFNEILIGYYKPMKSIPMLCFWSRQPWIGLACDIYLVSGQCSPTEIPCI